jgi:hypothetical protein
MFTGFGEFPAVNHLIKLASIFRDTYISRNARRRMNPTAMLEKPRVMLPSITQT